MSEEKNLRNMVRDFARDCCECDHTMDFHYTLLKERLWDIIAFAVREEREGCAKVCDALSTHPEYASEVTRLAAAAIRDRT